MPNKTESHETIIIGAGFSGLGLAMQLFEKNLPCLILERASDVGGVWRDNTYPAAACDVPSRLYSYSFAQNTNWSRSFSTQQEILAYLKSCVKHHKLSDIIQFNQTVIKASFDAESGTWMVICASGKRYTARFLITACGQLCQPSKPDIPGAKDFQGTHFHSAQWQHNHDFNAQKVAIIGTGASSIQFVPELAKVAKEVTVFQRTAPYVLPKRDRKIKAWENRLMTKLPSLQNMIRKLIYTKNEFRALYLGPLKAVLRLYTFRWRWFMHKHIKDPIKRKLLTPDYVIGCKRILISNNYYSTLNQPHIKLNDQAIKKFIPNGLLTNDDNNHQFDSVIWATGFKTADFLSGVEVTGIDRQSLHDKWHDGAYAYHGLTLNGFPNFLMCYGPNTNIGHNSMIHILESQFNYICDYIINSKTNNIRYLDLKADVDDSFQVRLHSQLKNTVWQQGGCHSWYQNKSGKNTNNWPGLTLTYRIKTQSINLADYNQVF